MNEPKWLAPQVIQLMHAEQLAEHGGAAGVREQGLLLSALARPRQAWSYGEADLAMLAALYASGIVRNHPFVDGNKRAAFLAAYVFLYVNGRVLEAPESEVAAMTLALAADEIDEPGYAAWLRAHALAR